MIRAAESIYWDSLNENERNVIAWHQSRGKLNRFNFRSMRTTASSREDFFCYTLHEGFNLNQRFRKLKSLMHVTLYHARTFSCRVLLIDRLSIKPDCAQWFNRSHLKRRMWNRFLRRFLKIRLWWHNRLCYEMAFLSSALRNRSISRQIKRSDT